MHLSGFPKLRSGLQAPRVTCSDAPRFGDEEHLEHVPKKIANLERGLVEMRTV